MWLRVIEYVAAVGLSYIAATLFVLGIHILRTPTHEWEAERRKILEQRKRAKEFWSFFRDK